MRYIVVFIYLNLRPFTMVLLLSRENYSLSLQVAREGYSGTCHYYKMSNRIQTTYLEIYTKFGKQSSFLVLRRGKDSIYRRVNRSACSTSVPSSHSQSRTEPRFTIFHENVLPDENNLI